MDLVASITHDSFSFGRNTKKNEDSIIEGTYSDISYFAVADGVGGCPGGGIASNFVVKKFEAAIKDSKSTDIHEIYKNLQFGLKELASENMNLEKMSTTLTSCIISNDEARIGHVGDSRLYIIRSNAISYKTTDHNMAQLLAINGESKYPIPSNILTSALSPAHDYKLEAVTFNLNFDDRILICSDGVYTNFSDTDLLTLSSKSNDCNSLLLKIKAILRIRGFSDDCSAICIDYTKPRGTNIWT